MNIVKEAGRHEVGLRYHRLGKLFLRCNTGPETRRRTSNPCRLSSGPAEQPGA